MADDSSFSRTFDTPSSSEDYTDTSAPPSPKPTYNLRTPRRVSNPRRSNGYTTPSRSTARSPATTPLRRREVRQKPASPKASPKISRRTQRRLSRATAPSTSQDIALFTRTFLRDILSIVLWFIRKPLVWAISCAILWFLLSAAWLYLKYSVTMALSPLCMLPGIGRGLPFCASVRRGKEGSGGWNAAGVGSIPKLINLQTHFEQVLEDSVGGSVMALDLKNSEIAVRDLNTLVKHSQLGCREDLSRRLEDFIGAAKSTSKQLSRFSSRVGGVVDNLLAIDDFAIHALEGARKTTIQPSGIKGVILSKLDPRPRYDLAKAEYDIGQTFIQAGLLMETSIRRLITEAEAALRELDNLEAKLNTIQDIVAREDKVIGEAEKEVLAEIWSYLGGNKAKIRNFKNHRVLLANISMYRKRAVYLVHRSWVQLLTMQSNLEELRDRVADPGLMQETGEEGIKIPIEVHIQSIRKGVDRLSGSMEQAKGREKEYMETMIAAQDDELRKLEEDTVGIES